MQIETVCIKINNKKLLNNSCYEAQFITICANKIHENSNNKK